MTDTRNVKKRKPAKRARRKPAKKSTRKKPAKRAGGRPTKYDEDRRRRIVEAVAGHCSRRGAADKAGIGESTLYEWMRKYPEFAEAVKKADGNAENKAVNAVVDAFEDHWQAAAWWLERRHPERWGKDRPLPVDENDHALVLSAPDGQRVRVGPDQPLPDESDG